MKMKRVDINDGSIAYLEGGNSIDSQSPIVFLHGYQLSSKAYVKSLSKLSNKYWIIAPDLPGFGRTRYGTSNISTYKDYTQILLEFFKAINLSSKVNLIGHSMGGGISIHLSATTPHLVESLVLIDSAGLPLNISLRTFFRKVAEFFIIQGLNTRFSSKYRRMVWITIFNFVRHGLAGPLRLLSIPVYEDLTPLIQTLVTPTCIIWGEKDLSIPLSHGIKLSRMISNSKIIVLDNLYHDWCVLYPEKLFSVFDGRLENHPISPSLASHLASH
jgi:abhydrolase domain-containing protein 6